MDSEDEKIEQFEQGMPLLDALDSEIIMHRDAHFGGKFDFMLDYYQKGGRGVQDDFPLERILYLSELERQLKQNLAPMVLSGADAEKIARAKDAYKELRELYEKGGKKSPALFIADLILAENDKEIEEAKDQIIKEGSSVVPLIIDLIQSEDFHDPLFPGYGLGPNLAIHCLGKIGDKRALIALFETLGESDFFSDEFVLDAIRAIGEPAKKFLMTVVAGKPWTEDNVKAAMGLLEFKNDPQVAKYCLDLLQKGEVFQDIALATYLILACEGLTEKQDQQALLKLAENPKIPKNLKLDIQTISHTWS